uniref:Uncharacterized protein n=1 Tax=Oryza rufipogon TaxID=4529 RepID=A0A0E0P9B2_ORYRU
MESMVFQGKEGINQWRREANQGAKHKARNPCLIEPSPNIRLVLALAQKPIYPSIPIAAASLGRPELLHAVVLSGEWN